MVKILLGLCVCIGLIVLWKIFLKIQINQHLQQFRIKQLADLIKPDATSAQPLSTAQARVDEVEEYEQQLFDDVCQIFFERHLTERNLLATVYGDRGYIGKSIKTKLLEQDIDLITYPRKNMRVSLLPFSDEYHLRQRKKLKR